MQEKNNSLKNFFEKDIHIKLISLAIAIVAWFGVMNAIAPLETKVFSTYVRVDNVKSLASQGYVIYNMDSIAAQAIDIEFEATRPALDSLTKANDAGDLVSVIDVGGISVDESEDFPQEFNINVQPKIPTYLNSSSYTIKAYKPSYLTVVVDKMVSVDKDLSVKTVGEPADDFEVVDVEPDIKTVTIGGTQTQIDKIASVVLNVDCSDISKNTEVKIEPVAYDKNNNEIRNLMIEPNYIGVKVKVQKRADVSINKPLTTGALPNYLELKSIDWSPKKVTVIGDAARVDALKVIDLEPVNLSNIKGDTTITRDISATVKKFGISTKNSKDNNVSITLKFGLVNPINVDLDKSAIKVVGLAEGKTITLPESIKVPIAGVASVDAKTLAPNINVAGLGDGTHNVKLNVTLPPNAAISSDTEVSVTIASKEQAQTTTIVDLPESFDKVSEAISEFKNEDEKEPDKEDEKS